MTTENNKQSKGLIDRVDDGFNYFYGYRLEETNTDDTYYIKSFMDYIEFLEAKLKAVSILKEPNNER